MFTREAPNRLWVTDITDYRTYEGKVYCAVVLDTFSGRVVGWSIDSHQTAAPVTNALSMAIANRDPQPGIVVHSDHGVQFTSWAFTDRAKRSGLVPSKGSTGDCYDKAMIESFWGRTQTELLNRKRWKTRIEVANATFDYLEIFHNRQRPTPPSACALRFSSNCYTNPPNPSHKAKYRDTAEPGAHHLH